MNYNSKLTTDRSVFLSYAREDDESFVERLYDNLTSNGFIVWWDRKCMPSRGLTFLQEIRDAIANCGRLIAVVGPEAVESEFVLAEWEWATHFGTIVIPILRLGEYDLLPDHFKSLNCPDFREDVRYEISFKDLVRILSEPLPFLGALYGVPALPAHFQPRPKLMRSLTNSVLNDSKQAIENQSAKQITALQGMGGIGKSVLAAALSRTTEVRRAYADGIVWLTFGREPNLFQPLTMLLSVLDENPSNYSDLQSLVVRLFNVLETKACLIIVDDIWEHRHIEPLVNALGPRCHLMITTREGNIVTILGAYEHRLEVFSRNAASHFLADWVGQPVDSLPADAASVANACGYLPFALALCGALARQGTPWSDLKEALESADISFIKRQMPNYPYPDVLRSFKVSIDHLAQADPTAAQLFCELAVFPQGERVPEETVLTLWLRNNGLQARYARSLLTTFEHKKI
jgi:hypothetical protein